MAEPWITASDLAAYFKVKLPTVRLWTRQGAPCLKAGRLVRFRVDAVESWLEAGGAKRSGKHIVNGQFVMAEVAGNAERGL